MEFALIISGLVAGAAKRAIPAPCPIEAQLVPIPSLQRGN